MQKPNDIGSSSLLVVTVKQTITRVLKDWTGKDTEMKSEMIILGFAIVFCCTAFGAFIPEDSQENKLVRRFMSGISASQIFPPITDIRRERSRLRYHFHCPKDRGSLGQIGRNRHVNDYIFALQEHHSIQQRNNENAVICATEHLGGCARKYPNILRSWTDFFGQRNFQARPLYPIHKLNTGQSTTASFGRYSLSGYTADDLHAVDLIVSRSSVINQVVYGRYHFQVSTSEDLPVYDDQQATCGTDEDSYFALGLNEDGYELIRNWMTSEIETIELSLRAQTLRQFSSGSNDNFVSSGLDLEANIEALILHLRVSTPKPFPKSVFPELAAKRRKRRSWVPRPNDCQRKTYKYSFKFNRHVISPKWVDIGLCDGSCDYARMPNAAGALNSTGHTMKVLWDRFTNRRDFGNPEPKACCFPNVYESFYFVTRDFLDNLYVDYVEEFIARNCSCR